MRSLWSLLRQAANFGIRSPATLPSINTTLDAAESIVGMVHLVEVVLEPGERTYQPLRGQPLGVPPEVRRGGAAETIFRDEHKLGIGH